MKHHRTVDLEPTLFGGRYALLRRLAVGGMAEIYLARQGAMAGFEKLVVIKRLRAELARDARIVEMFLDEARIGALLNHPNIVHVYDVDEHDGIPYIAMEHIVGEELNELCRRGIAHGSFLPLEHAVELMRQAAAGMGYFHTLRPGPEAGAAAGPLDIVHLDISPSNLLVTQDGFLKIIDFGIANARGQRQRTDVLPGKLGYMSPEQAARKPVDHRSDIFSLGIVLYEITVGRRLFRGPAREVIARLTEAKIDPPTFIRRKFPSALEAIVMRTLERHPDARYQSAYDLADDLEAFLREAHLHSGPVRIARYLDALSQAAGGPPRPELVTEAEVRGAGPAELDFDSQVWGAFAPAAAKEWEDADQPEADVAAALGMELDELRALRTPGGLRPPGSPREVPAAAPRGGEGGAAAAAAADAAAAAAADAPTRAMAPIADGDGDGDADATTPVTLVDEDEVSRPSGGVAVEDQPTLSAPGLAAAGLSASAGPGASAGPPSASAGLSASAGPGASAGPPPAAGSRPGSTGEVPAWGGAPAGFAGGPADRAQAMRMGAAPLGSPRPYGAPAPSLGQRLPWILVGALVVAVASLVAYIVVGA